MSTPAFTFYLGTQGPNWLSDEPVRHPLFISVRRLDRYKSLKPAVNDWCMDSGGFTELTLHNRWVTTPEQYVEKVERAVAVGRLVWASPQDWMCEPHMVAKTGLSVHAHQQATCDNYATLKQLAPHLPIIPVLQGWHPDDYLQHAEMYARLGIDLTACTTVGLGSVCRRTSLDGLRTVVADLANSGLRLHGFGVKRDGLRLLRNHLVSSDSLAWSFDARTAGWRGQYRCGIPHRGKSCVNCKTWALMWADKMAATTQTAQPMLWHA